MSRLAPHTYALIAASIGVSACTPDDTPHPIMEAFAQEPPPATFGSSVAFRFSREEGGDIEIYRLPDLEEVAWHFAAPRITTDRVVGYAPHESQIYFTTVAGDLTTLDLQSGRVQRVDSLIATSVIGPTNVPFTIRQDGTVGAFQDRHLEVWPDTLPTVPEAIWGATRGRLLSLFGGTRPSLAMVTPNGVGERVPAPAEDVIASAWGDLLIFTTDSGLILLDAEEEFEPSLLPLPDRPVAVAFSPSAHRIIVATPQARLIAFDRYSLTEVLNRPLPAPASGIRPDPLGRFIMLRSPAPDSIWIAHTADTVNLETVAAVWTDELPTVAPDGTVLLRDGSDALVAVDPNGWRVTGTVAAGGSDAWLTLTWDPRRPALQLAVDAQEAADSITEGSGRVFYAQVSSSSSHEWADGLVTNLRGAGIEARVLEPDFFYERYRVVLGPFENREEADNNGSKLGLPYFIFSEDTTNLAR